MLLNYINLCSYVQLAIGGFYFEFQKNAGPPKDEKRRKLYNKLNMYSQLLAYGSILVNAVIIAARTNNP
jgi:hypothetical protein